MAFVVAVSSCRLVGRKVPRLVNLCNARLACSEVPELLNHSSTRSYASRGLSDLGICIDVCSWSAVLVQCSRGLCKACAGAQGSSQPEPEGCFCDSPRPSNNGTYLLPSCLLLAVPQCFVNMSITRLFPLLHVNGYVLSRGLTKDVLMSDRVEWQG